MKNQIQVFIDQLPPEYHEFEEIMIKLRGKYEDVKAENEKLKEALDIILTGKLQTPKGLRAFIDGWVDCEFEYAEAISKALKEE